MCALPKPKVSPKKAPFFVLFLGSMLPQYLALCFTYVMLGHFYVRDLWWKITFGGRHPLVEGGR